MCTNTNYTEGNQSVVDMIKMAKMHSYMIRLMVAGASNISVIELYMDAHVYIYIYINFIMSVLGMCVPLCLLLYFLVVSLMCNCQLLQQSKYEVPKLPSP